MTKRKYRPFFHQMCNLLYRVFVVTHVTKFHDTTLYPSVFDICSLATFSYNAAFLVALPQSLVSPLDHSCTTTLRQAAALRIAQQDGGDVDSLS